MKRIISFSLTLAIFLSFFSIQAAATPNPASANEIHILAQEDFFSETSRLITENWEEHFFTAAVFTVGSPYMLVDGVQTAIDPETNVSPAIVGGKPMLPLRTLADKANGDISFDSASQRILIDAGQNIELTLGSAQIIVDGDLERIETAPVTISGRTMVYINDAIPEYLGFEVNWNPEDEEITLTRDFQTRRLVLDTLAPMDFGYLGAADVARGQYMTLLQFETVSEAKATYKYLSAHPNVEWVHADYVISPKRVSDEEFMSFAVNDDGDFAPANARSWGVDRIGANRYAAYLRSRGLANTPIVVAVLDTGIEASHSFFGGTGPNGRLVAGGRCTITNSNDIRDNDRHGTHVAGTVVDATPGLNVRILTVRVLNPRGTASSVANGIDWARVQHGVRVINMSLGGGNNSGTLNAIQRAVNQNSISNIAAAGNDSTDTARVSPANSPVAITVSATDSQNRRASFTNWGAAVDVGAPGVGINSAILNNRFGNLSGTSMAAPHVAAAAAMYHLRHPNHTPAQVRAAMRSYVNVPSGWNTNRYGRGILNLDLAPRGIRHGFVLDRNTITAADVTALRRYIASTNRADFPDTPAGVGFNVPNADANGDGYINSSDVTLLRRWIAAPPNDKPILGGG